MGKTNLKKNFLKKDNFGRRFQDLRVFQTEIFLFLILKCFYKLSIHYGTLLYT